ncbi:MAG TPA: multicopper oxidase domain-containing protein [Candidatus Methylomirabilis sp.]|nr:multicopper oxidase domain-containing protein [Candidatus Methylomirabilis sp.]HSC72409.1 multicopper oxidase domain-containing protein [Candidatus Methylomirabilis sp.]
MSRISRRQFLAWGLPAGIGVTGVAVAATDLQGPSPASTGMIHPNPAQHVPGRPIPTERQAAGAPDPMQILTAFDYGKVTRLPGGQVQREYTLTAFDREIQVAKGVTFPAWTFNGAVPGPTIRCTEGDRLLIHFRNEGSMPHTVHLHGIHRSNMDGVFEIVPPGDSYDYELVAEPFGLFLYHCHVMPLKKHIHKGLYGTFIVDPKTPRPPAKELVMVMNGFDTDLDGENEFYTVNGIANYYADHPIPLQVGEPVRIYVVNLLEFDLINSFHLHGNVFKLYRTGTSLTSSEITDTVMLCQGERCILEFTYNHPGKFMFHAHQSEFAELGWMGLFDVRAKVEQG